MSSPHPDTAALEEQVAELQQQVAALTLRVEELTRRLDETQSSGFEVVPEVPESASGSAAAETGEFGGPYSWTFREAVAKEIGHFLRRSLSGNYRGSSGREKVKELSSRFYLVVRDYEGNLYQRPVRVLTRFSEVRALCQRGGDWGDSIFVGVPSKREGLIAARTAELQWPPQSQ